MIIALIIRMNFRPPRTAPKTLLIPPKAAIFKTRVKNLASKLIPIIIAINVSAKRTPAGGIRSFSRKLSRSVPKEEENNNAPTRPKISATSEAASTMNPLENPFTAPKKTKPIIAMSM